MPYTAEETFKIYIRWRIRILLIFNSVFIISMMVLVPFIKWNRTHTHIFSYILSIFIFENDRMLQHNTHVGMYMCIKLLLCLGVVTPY